MENAQWAKKKDKSNSKMPGKNSFPNQKDDIFRQLSIRADLVKVQYQGS
jgi:hypothetical protein